MNEKSNLKLIGTARSWYTDENGNKLYYVEKKNAVVLSGFDFVRKAISDDSNRPAVMKYVAIGSGSTATNTSMTALENEFARQEGTWSYDEDNKTFTITAVFPRGTISSAVQEIGVLNAASEGILLDRCVYESPIPALSNLEFTGILEFELA